MNRINLICLGVRDMARSLAFYKNMGFRTYETEAAPPIVFFDNQGTKLELYPLENLARDLNPDDPPPLSTGGFNGITLACNMKSREDVDAAVEAAQTHGGRIVKQPQDVSWGGYSGYFQDPDGYVWEVAYAGCWTFDENDMLVIEPMSPTP